MKKISLLVGALFVAGCLGPRPDPSTFYHLTAEASRGASAVPVRVGLGPITLPGYLDRPQMVTRMSENQVGRSEAARWAEPLYDNIWGALAENLTRSIQPESVVAFPWHPSVGVDYGVALDFAHIEADSSGVVRLEVAWKITDDRSGAVLERRATVLDEDTERDGTEAKVVALSRALARLSDEIAAGLRHVHNQRGAR